MPSCVARVPDQPVRLLSKGEIGPKPLLDEEIPDHPGETVRTEQEEIVRVRHPGNQVDGQRVMDPYCPKDHVPVSVNPRLPGSEQPPVDLLLDERVVLRHLPKPTSPEQVDAAVPHMTHHVSIAGEDNHLPRAAHTIVFGLPDGEFADALIGEEKRSKDEPLGFLHDRWRPGGNQFPHGVRKNAAGHFAGCRPSHSVRQCQKPQFGR